MPVPLVTSPSEVDAGVEAAVEAEASASKSRAQAPTCPPAAVPRGYEACDAVELTDAPPCESICSRARRAGSRNPCCETPVEVVVLSGASELLRVAACRFVPPDCAHVHGHGNMDSELRVLSGSPPEVVVVEGGCEMRAMMHGYVPPGVAAWTGCEHKRYRWDGRRLALVKP